MTNTTTLWQDKQKENKLSDADLSYRVNRRIAKWQKKTELAEQTRQSIAENETEIQQHADKPYGHKYKTLSRELEDMKAFLADTEAEAAQLNDDLCEDMDRLVRDAEKNKRATENLKGKAGNKPLAPPPPKEETTTDPLAIPDSITDEMKTDLHCLNYTPEDVEAMDVATAIEIIKKQKGKGFTTAQINTPATNNIASSVPILITTAMRQQLHSLGYSKEDIDAMRPEDANEILASNLAKPAPSSAAGSGTAPVIKLQPKRTETTPAPQNKKNQNAMLIAIGTAISFGIGLLIGRQTTKK